MESIDELVGAVLELLRRLGAAGQPKMQPIPVDKPRRGDPPTRRRRAKSRLA